jgi:thioredoxin 1
MRTLFFLFGFTLLFFACSSAQQGKRELLSPTDFSKQLAEAKEAIVLDVRTPGEFAGGALANARNVDWNGDNFDKEVAGLDKSKPLFVYCLSGGRSSSAAASLRKAGFARVVELDGGIMAWRNAGLPLGNAGAAKVKGMTQKEFSDKIATSGKKVLVDFYAEWCGPCKKMKPDLDWLSQQHGQQVWVWRIDADAHPDLAQALGVDGLPTLFVYEGNKQTLRLEGLQSREQMLQALGIK